MREYQRADTPADDLVYVVDQVVKYSKRNPIKMICLGLGSAIAFTSFIGYLNFAANKKETEFRAQLKQNPPQGSIAYIVNDEIHTIRAEQVCTENKTTGKFQVPGYLERLIWLDNNKIIFIGKQKDEINGKLMPEYSVVSDSVYKLDVKTGNIETLFDPYSQSSAAIFGDVKAADELKKAEIKEFMEEKKDAKGKRNRDGVRMVMGDHSNLNITNMGISDKKIYVEVNTKWYSLNENGDEMSLVTKVPENLRFTNTQNQNPQYLIKDGILFFNARFTNGDVLGCEFEDNAQNFDWNLDN